jgi:carbonic anhydrase/acetyltransferase-like protein (isoleucine patch superfamily)
LFSIRSPGRPARREAKRAASSTVLNGARIGRNCLVGANALVTEGKEFPDNSLIVGAPAKAVRTLDAEAAERLRASALGYVANWQKFARGLKLIG